VRVKKGVYDMMGGVYAITGQWDGVRVKKGVRDIMYGNFVSQMPL